MERRPLKLMKQFQCGVVPTVFHDLTPTQVVVLQAVARKAVYDRVVARMSKRGFAGGWTYVRPTRRVKLRTVQRLIDLGLVCACCEGHYGTDAVRITGLGILYLEHLTGQEVTA